MTLCQCRFLEKCTPLEGDVNLNVVYNIKSFFKKSTGCWPGKHVYGLDKKDPPAISVV